MAKRKMIGTLFFALIAEMDLVIKNMINIFFVSHYLGANDGSAALARLSRECYSVFLLCFVSQGFFSLACCLLFFEEKRKLLAANLILYAILLSGCVLVTASGPSMTGYMTMNEISVLAADLYLILCFLPQKNGAPEPP